MKRQPHINQNILTKLFKIVFLFQSFLISNLALGNTSSNIDDTRGAEKLLVVKTNWSNKIDTISHDSLLYREIPDLYDIRKWTEITGAISFISTDRLKNVAGTNIFNSLTGLIPGLLVVQNNSFPGKEVSSLYIRGQRTFGPSNKTPLILLDGIETEITQINPYDIESVTVLKDAVSTAMYGLRATNGIILITSRIGRPGSLKVNINSLFSILQPTRLPEFLNSAQYASLYNEACKNENLVEKYTVEDINAFRDGTNSFKYPNNNWVRKFTRDYSIQARNDFDISGGNENVKYFFSAGYIKNNGYFITEKNLNTYNTNSASDLINIRTNLDIDASDRLSLNIDLRTNYSRQNSPGIYNSNFENNLFNDMINTPPLAYPILNPDGSLGGTPDYMNNLYGQLNKSGYSIWARTNISGIFKYNYKLDFILKGLTLQGRLGFVSFMDHITNRSKSFAVYQMINETTYNKIGLDTQMSSTDGWSNNNKNYKGNIGLEYVKSFKNSSIKGRLLYDRQEYIARSTKLPHILQGLQSSISSIISSKYLIDFTCSYQGNEQYPTGNRYGLFPAIGVGWILSNENFMSNVKFFNYLKIRASAGQTGNEFNPVLDGTPYFAWIENYSAGGAYSFGINPASDGGFYQSNIANSLITWEKTFKYDIGVEALFFKNKLSLNFDYFNEKNNDILISNATPGIFGANFWYPDGIVKNQGIEMSLEWNDKIGDFTYFISSNAAFIKNKIVEQKESDKAYDWMIQTGNSIGTKFGYVYDRFITEDDNISQLPDQSSLGQVHPGDLKYIDLNGDNIINNNDQMKIGGADLPEMIYGVSAGFSLKGIDFSVLFQGVASTDKIFAGSLVQEFVNGKGNVTKEHLGRWTPGSDQNATYPRLAIQQFSNSHANSTFWVKDCSYLRLKTIELGYTLAKSSIEKAHFDKIRLFVNAYNLFTWSKLKVLDPETSSYGINRIVSGGLNISF